MRVVFASYAEPSHFRVMVPLAWAFLAAGHEVRVAGPPELMRTATDAGLTGVPVGRDTVIRSFLERRPHLTRGARSTDQPPFGRGDHPEEEISWEYLHSGYTNSVNWLFRMANDPMIDDLVEFTRSWQADLVLWEPGTLAAPIAAEAAGSAHARVVFGLDFYGRMRELFVRRRTEEPGRPDPLAEWMAARIGRFGGEFSEEMTTGMATVDQSPGSLCMPTGRDVVPMRYVPYNGTSVVPRWLRDPPERPRVCLTLGGSADDPVASSEIRVREILESLGGLDADVVATVSPDEFGNLPDNVHAVGFAPLNALLPHCSAAVNHGGFGSVNTALVNGLPQLVIPEYFDAPAKGRRLAELGAGLTLTPAEATGDEVRTSLTALLEDPRYRARARELQKETEAQPAPSEVVPRLLALAERVTGARRGRARSSAGAAHRPGDRVGPQAGAGPEPGIRERVRNLTLEVKAMTVGLAPGEGGADGGVDLSALDEFGLIHLVLYLEEEFDVAVFERLGTVDWTTSDDIARFLVETFPAEVPAEQPGEDRNAERAGAGTGLA